MSSSARWDRLRAAGTWRCACRGTAGSFDERRSAVYVHHVGDGLECEERDADGKGEAQLGYELLAEGAVDVHGQEALVLAEAQDEKIQREGARKKRSGSAALGRCTRDGEAEGPVESDGSRHEPRIHRLAPRAEQKRERCHHVPRRALGHGEVHRKKQK